MPRYFLHLRGGNAPADDPEGVVLASLEAAVAEAEKGAREILAEQLRTGEPLDGQRIEVSDGDGKVLATVRFRDVFSVD